MPTIVARASGAPRRTRTTRQGRTPWNAATPSRTVGSLLAVSAVARLVSVLLLWSAWAAARAGGPLASAETADGGPGFAGFLGSWDGRWYSDVAEHGYPADLPTEDGGAVVKNAWAFLPLFPALLRALGAAGLSATASGILLSVVAGTVATLLLHRLLADRVGDRPAFWGAVFFAVGPMSFLFVLPYAEALSLVFVFGALVALGRDRLTAFTVLTVAAAFTRPGALALTATLLGLHLLALWRHERLPRRTHLARWAAVVVTGLAGLAWPVVAAVATGRPDAYFRTESAWWRDYVGTDHFTPFTPWFVMASHWFGAAGVVAVVVVLVAAVTGIVVGRKRVGELLATWTFADTGFLVAVFLPQQSTVRMLLPLAPQLGHPALSSSSTRVVVVITASVVLQAVCIVLFWVVWPA